MYAFLITLLFVNLSFLQHLISMTPGSILQSCLQYCCYSLVFLCTLDCDFTFPRITDTCHSSLLRFILPVILSVLKRSSYVQHINKCLLSFCLQKSQFSFTVLNLPKHGLKYYPDPKSYTSVSPYFIEPLIWYYL